MSSPASLSNRASARLAIVIGVVCVIVIALRIATPWFVKPDEPDDLEPSTATVTIQVDAGDGSPVETLTTGHLDGMTVIDAMRNVRRESPSFTFESSGKPVFVEAIGGKRGGVDGRYWLFEVNGQHSEIGAGEATLEAGDRVLWQLKASE